MVMAGTREFQSAGAADTTAAGVAAVAGTEVVAVGTAEAAEAAGMEAVVVVDTVAAAAIAKTLSPLIYFRVVQGEQNGICVESRFRYFLAFEVW